MNYPRTLALLALIPSSALAQTAGQATTLESAHPGKISPAFAAHIAEAPGTHLAWVLLADKGVGQGPSLDAALRDLESTYNPRALARRQLRRTDPGLVDERDLPIPASDLASIAATGATIRQTSRWATAVSVRATPAQLLALTALPRVTAIEPVRTGPASSALDTQAIPPGTYADRDFYGLSSAQLNQLNLTALHTQGFTGAGVVVGILDTGFRYDHTVFHQPGHELPIVAEHDFVFNDNTTTNEPADDPGQHNHGTLILGCIRAYQPNSLVGGAYDASVILCKTEDIRSETPVEEDNYVAGLEFIEAHGGDMATSSLGYIDWYAQSQLDGHTAVTSIAVNTATANGLHCCTAAGNEGHDTNPATNHIIAPADAFRVITCGAVDANGDIAGFSSDGPSADGRVKPEVLARGVSTLTIHFVDSTSFAAASGTSLSTPLVAAAVACLIQAHPTWTTDQMRAALIATASDQVATGSPDPLFIRGFGILNAANASAFTSCDPDLNQDGNADQDDVAYLINVIGGGPNPSAIDPDFNHDGNADQDDVAALINTIGGAPCP